MIRALAILYLLLLAGPVFAQENLLPTNSPLKERYSPAAEISGAPVMGLVVHGETALSMGQIVARVPADWTGQIVCARMVSSDGRYEAEREYSVPEAWQSGTANLDFPTAYAAQLAQFDNEELGILVTLGSCGSGPMDRTIVPAGWDLTGLAKGAALMVNSFRADETYLIIADLNLDISCQPAISNRRTAFDTICQLPPAVLASASLLKVELNRIRRGVMVPADVFDIDMR